MHVLVCVCVYASVCTQALAAVVDMLDALTENENEAQEVLEGWCVKHTHTHVYVSVNVLVIGAFVVYTCCEHSTAGRARYQIRTASKVCMCVCV